MILGVDLNMTGAFTVTFPGEFIGGGTPSPTSGLRTNVIAPASNRQALVLHTTRFSLSSDSENPAVHGGECHLQFDWRGVAVFK